MFKSFYKKLIFIVFVHAMIVSCDGSAPGENAITNTNNVPVFVTESILSINENTLDPIAITATDADEVDEVRYELTAGDDQALFELDNETGELTFIAAADYEVPVDAGEDNIYTFIITASDEIDLVSQEFFITVVNVDDNLPIAENLLVFDSNSGALVEGDTLVSNYQYSDIDGDLEGASTIQWFRNGIEIDGATAATYVIVAADVDQQLNFQITPVSSNGSAGVPVSSSFITTTNNAPVASAVVISGDSNGVASLGDTLNGSYVYSDQENDAEGLTAFRWLRDGVPIVGVTVDSYTLVSADVGSVIRFEVTPFSNSGTSPGVVVLSAAVSVLNTAPVASNVTISGDTAGTASEGDILSGGYLYTDLEGDVEGTTTFRWLRNGSAIIGATASTYTIAPADAGAVVRFEVTPVSVSGTSPGAAVESTAGISIVNNAPVASAVLITGDTAGSAALGDSLTGNYTYSDLEGDAEGGSIYRWYRGGVPISGASLSTYTVAAADVGSVLTFEVTPVAATGTSTGLAVVSSNAINIDNIPPVASSVVLTGDTGGNAFVGDVLTGGYVYSDAENDAEGTSTFRWLRDGVGIGGATSIGYTVVLADLGTAISFEVTPVSVTGTSPGAAAVSSGVNIVNTAPVASSVSISGDTAGNANTGDVLTGSYSFADGEGDPDDATTFRWLRDGVAIGSATTTSYTVTDTDANANAGTGSVLSFEVTPGSSTGVSPGSAVASSGVTILNEAPSVSSVAISGDTAGVANVGDVLTGGYLYSDLESNIDASTFRWLRDGSAISGATTTSYTVTVADAASSITFEVTPVSTIGTSPGTVVTSSAVTVPTNVSTVSTCTTNEFGTSNKLGVSRYVRFDITQSQSIDLVATTSAPVPVDANPDLFLYKNGVLQQSATDVSTTQTMTVSVTPGTYVLQVRENAYMSGGASSAQTCYDVSISYGAGSAKPQGKPSAPVVSNEKAGSSVSSCDPTGEVNVSGALTYQRVPHNAVTSGLDYTGIIAMPIRGAVVEVICDVDGLMYDTGVTDAAGNYTLTAPNGVASYIRVKAQLLDPSASAWDVEVIDNTSGDALYAMDSSATPFTPAGVDVTGEDYVAATAFDGNDYTSRVGAPFAILDSVYDAIQEVLAADPSVILPALDINWSNLNSLVSGDLALGQIGTSFYSPGLGEIYILGDEDSDTDEFDKHVIIHEWAHYFEDKLSRSDSMGGAHGIGDILDMRIAFGEGFGNAFSGIVSGDPVYVDSSGANQSTGFDFDVSSDVCANAGWYSECSVQSILFDIDALIGFTPIYNVLINEQKNTTALTSIFSFIKPLKDNNVGSATAIDAEVSDHSISSITDIYGDSELTNNPGATDLLPVYEQF